MRIQTLNLSLSIATLLLLNSCSVFEPTHKANVWQDDYTAITSMDNYSKWGTYNVHDPSILKIDEYFYAYSTDAIYRENKKVISEQSLPFGYIQIRRSKDLVNWEFCGWAFDAIPEEAVEWVRSQTQGKGATNIWAPYIIRHKDKFRLYYCVSAFGRKSSYIGLAESSSPDKGWVHKGAVVKSSDATVMNAIDPSIIIDRESGKWWMHYGSFFGGLYCVELDKESGLTIRDGDLGHLIARRANYKKDNLEAPEIIYNEELQEYYLFSSYDPLMTTYNVRVGRSKLSYDNFVDFEGYPIRDTTNNLPILTAPYRFENHNGWAGTAHCSVFTDNEGRYFMAHQGRLAPSNHQMVLHVRELFFNQDGWPVISPERYSGSKPRRFSEGDLVGEWEIIKIQEPIFERQLEAGQILYGEGDLHQTEWNSSTRINIQRGGICQGSITQVDNFPIKVEGIWQFDKKEQLLDFKFENGEEISNMIIHAGHDWENERETILFTALDSEGRTVWGKRVK